MTEMIATYVMEVLGGANVRSLFWAWAALRCLYSPMHVNREAELGSSIWCLAVVCTPTWGILAFTGTEHLSLRKSQFCRTALLPALRLGTGRSLAGLRS
jgi:hypothetical protein